MRSIILVAKDLYSYFKPSNKIGIFRFATLVLLLVTVSFFTLKPLSHSDNKEIVQQRAVEVLPVSSFSNTSSLELIGTVESKDQAVIKTEVAGRVTSVNANLGDFVRAGQVIATLENASEYASVLQAEGAYESAVARAAQSDIGTSEAEQQLQLSRDQADTTYKSALTSVRNILESDIDQLFSDPHELHPGLRISAGKYTKYFVSERKWFEEALKTWQDSILNDLYKSDQNEGLLIAKETTIRMIKMLELFVSVYRDLDEAPPIPSTTLETDIAILHNVISQIDTAVVSLSNASDQLKKAQIGGTQTDVSEANAQVKQALGVLKAAQANYAKTILKTPIAGLVNTLDIQTGDFVTAFSLVATIANNNALEITTFVSEPDMDLVKVGNSVVIEGVYNGLITNISPAVNPLTRKVEVKIQSESDNIANGDTVSVEIPLQNDQTKEDGRILVPLTAVKFSGNDSTVFTVENKIVTPHQVTIGNVRGSNIEILDGLSRSTEIIVDARGLTAGEQVEVLSR